VAQGFAHKRGRSVDVTAAQVNTLADASVAVAKALQTPVQVVAFFEPGDRAVVELRALVQRYQQHTTHLQLTQLSLKDDIAAARAAGVLDGGARVLVQTGTGDDARVVRIPWQQGDPLQEQQLTNALRQLSTTTRPRVYVVAGTPHEPQVEGPAGLSKLKESLAGRGIDVVPLPLLAAGGVPDDAAVVVVAGAREPLSAPELSFVRAYLNGGGRALLAFEPGVASGLEQDVGAFGVFVVDDVVLDRSAFSTLLGGAEGAAGVTYAAHPVSRPLGSAITHFIRARSLAENPGTGAVFVPLVQTGAEAWGETTTDPAVEPQADGADAHGPLTLVALSTLPRANGEREQRVAVAGDATFLTNAALPLGHNRDLAVNLLVWLAQDETALSVEPRRRGGNLLYLSPSRRQGLAFVLLFLLPIGVLAAGLSLWAARRG
jgi:ABC-type uncharacterized transport system involved in gliding motility auxiliary subunit